MNSDMNSEESKKSIDVMDIEYINEFDVVRRYHLNKLNDNELNSFEVYILENPDIIADIENEKVLHEAFKDHEALLKNKEQSALPAWGRGLAVAACLVVAVITVLNFSGSPAGYDLQPPVILETFRGAGENSVQLSGQPMVQFQIDMGPAEFIEDNSFTAELVDSAGISAFLTSGLVVDADGWLFYILEGQSQQLVGDHTVRIYPDNRPAQVVSHNIQFTSQ